MFFLVSHSYYEHSLFFSFLQNFGLFLGFFYLSSSSVDFSENIRLTLLSPQSPAPSYLGDEWSPYFFRGCYQNLSSHTKAYQSHQNERSVFR